MGLTVKGLEHPHRYVLEAAQTHVFLLMKKVHRCTLYLLYYGGYFKPISAYWLKVQLKVYTGIKDTFV